MVQEPRREVTRTAPPAPPTPLSPSLPFTPAAGVCGALPPAYRLTDRRRGTRAQVGAMRMLVDYILKGGSPSGDGREVSTDEQVRIEQDKLQQLCLYQLVLGYRLREAEATGEAQQRLGL